MSRFRHIRRVAVQPGYKLLLDWDDGSQSVKDMTDLIRGRVAFMPLADPSIFAKVRVADHGRALRWTRKIDYCADALWIETKAEDAPTEVRLNKAASKALRQAIDLRSASLMPSNVRGTKTPKKRKPKGGDKRLRA